MDRRRILVIALSLAVLAVLYRAIVLTLLAARALGLGDSAGYWQGEVVQTTIRVGPIEADVYTAARSRLPVLMIHGVNETGKDSPEFRSVAEALAGAGFRVIVPELVRLTRQNMTPADIDEIEYVFQSIGDDAGLMCVSYGCGPALIAASRPGIRDRVRFILTFGAYYDLTDTLRFIVTNPDSPLAYSKWLYMAANADLLLSENDRDQIRAIAEEREKNPFRNWSLSSRSLSREGRAVLSLYESVNTAEFDRRLSEAPTLKTRTELLSPSRYFEGLRAPMIIVHMSADPCIPSSESVRLAEAARARRIPYSLTILRMYGHTRPQWPAFGIGSLLAFYLPESLRFLKILHVTLNYAG